jgi:hypothetical protein
MNSDYVLTLHGVQSKFHNQPVTLTREQLIESAAQDAAREYRERPPVPPVDEDAYINALAHNRATLIIADDDYERLSNSVENEIGDRVEDILAS